MSRTVLANQVTVIGTMDAPGSFLWVLNSHRFSPEVRNSVERFCKRNTLRQKEQSHSLPVHGSVIQEAATGSHA